MNWIWDREKFRTALAGDGAYLLRSNQAGWSAQEFWETYIQLTVVERAFRVLKSELLLRPVWHHYSGRTQAHVMICVWLTPSGRRWTIWPSVRAWRRRSASPILAEPRRHRNRGR